MKEDFSQGPGLKIPPPVFYLGSAGIGIGMEHEIPTHYLPTSLADILALVLALLAFILIIAVMRHFKRAATPFDVRQGAASLVTDGVMKFSRNPGYLALSLFYISIGLFLNNFWLLALLIPLLLMMNLRVIRREELHLEQVFGDEYVQYKQRVRRWF